MRKDTSIYNNAQGYTSNIVTSFKVYTVCELECHKQWLVISMEPTTTKERSIVFST